VESNQTAQFEQMQPEMGIAGQKCSATRLCIHFWRENAPAAALTLTRAGLKMFDHAKNQTAPDCSEAGTPPVNHFKLNRFPLDLPSLR
jgi:hypothetical protein